MTADYSGAEHAPDASRDASSFIFTMLFAGALATIAFDFLGQGLSPAVGFANLSPVGLAKSTLEAVFGAAPKGAPEMVHFITGVVLYPLGWLLIARPVWKAIMPSLPWAITALVYGVVLWVFALYIVAHLIAGQPPFLDFTGIAWVALVGHVVFAMVFAWGAEARRFG